MVVRAITKYRDKFTKEIFVEGSFREVSDERGKELIDKGFVVEYVFSPPKVKKEKIAETHEAKKDNKPSSKGESQEGG